MLQNIKLAVISVLLAAGVAVAIPLTVAAGAAGDAATSVCEGITAGGGSCADDGGGLSNVIVTVIRILSIIVGVAAVIMIIIGGLKFVTSGGDSSKTASAKSTILYAIVGLIIAALAQILVRFVLTTATTETT